MERGLSTQDLSSPGTADFALMLAVLGHAYGWPVARGGSQALADHAARAARAGSMR